ncbi:LuxR family transcriptional regulator [Microbulbifer flavimaris]|uniref:LuxR family transcriptional regulator n=1 Tax=Microbulbifer flavimaris TaxID=1781068 RepID=A0ABX4HXB3_9GAMM|nr:MULTISPECIES: LuxR C-terminal-related transcriptional regulator [Microbulbifer]KUJ82538.1 helix-turn-helix transcriptional regulator [Microbulbifer sp. ZGT114]PCO04747.1 LuxR family transcriptional regulator [Microbulbifer flavimaris]
MPVLFFSQPGLQGELLYALVSEALPMSWEKAELGRQRHCLQHYSAIVVDCWQILSGGDSTRRVTQLRSLDHPLILLINFPQELSSRVANQLRAPNIHFVSDAACSQQTLIRNLREALEHREDARRASMQSRLLLTRREQEILFQLTTGDANSTIASRLHLSEHTVKNHMYNIFKKIGVKNRVQASNWAKLHLEPERT